MDPMTQSARLTRPIRTAALIAAITAVLVMLSCGLTLNQHQRIRTVGYAAGGTREIQSPNIDALLRGLREFEWAGYHVRVTVPGRDHFMLNAVNLPLRADVPKSKRDKGDVLEGEIGKILAEEIHSGLGVWRKK